MPTANPAAIQDWYARYPNVRPPTGVMDETPTAIDPNQFDVTDRTQGYTANTATGTNWNVGDEQTVESRVRGIIDQDSPLQQQARTRSLEAMNQRGLLSSSMAVGAGQGAVIASALPIAQQDATTFGNAARYNADTANAMSTFNATSRNQADQFTAGSRNTGLIESARMGLSAAQGNQSVNQALTQQGRDISSREGMQAADLSAQTARQDSMQRYDSALRTQMQAADFAGREVLTRLDGSVRESLANIEARYRTQMQTSASMAQTYQSMTDGITRILMNPDLDGPAKQDAINNLTRLYDGALQQQSAISGLDLGRLLGEGWASTGAVVPGPTRETRPTDPSFGTGEYPGGGGGDSGGAPT